MNWIQRLWRKLFPIDYGNPVDWVWIDTNAVPINEDIITKRLTLKSQIAKLKRQKKKHSHLVAELQALTNEELRNVR